MFVSGLYDDGGQLFPPLRAGGDDGVGAVLRRREDLLTVRDRHTLALALLRGDGDLADLRKGLVGDVVRDERLIARERLRLRRLLARVLRHGLLRNRDERLPRLAIQEVEPAGLAGLPDPL